MILLSITEKKEEKLPDWYSQVITKAELIEYYDVSDRLHHANTLNT